MKFTEVKPPLSPLDPKAIKHVTFRSESSPSSDCEFSDANIDGGLSNSTARSVFDLLPDEGRAMLLELLGRGEAIEVCFSIMPANHPETIES